jgi:predicted AAA+ superfamily ATPase
MQELESWKQSPSRKPLILRGARQVGKTWLMRAFGEKNYQNIAYFNFEKASHLKEVFSGNFDVRKIVLALQAESGIKIEPEKTLIVFDEIQTIPQALTALKYFLEDAPQYHVICAGSLLGIALNQKVSFPVGKVDFLNLHPMSFPEFLDAMNEQKLLELIQQNEWEVVNLFRDKMVTLLRYYYFVGGMPEAVKVFSSRGDFNLVRDVQQNILTAYENDFSKHAPVDVVPRLRMVWNSIPAQLAKENRKFIYGKIQKGSRSKDYEIALSWLVDCGLAVKVPRVSKPGLPLKAYEEAASFKLYLVDVGLLSALSNLSASIIINSNKGFTEFKGALTEQFVLQQLSSSGLDSYFWSAERATAEVDFVVQLKEGTYPIEVKANVNLQAKSLKVYYNKFSPPRAIRTSLAGFKEQDWLINIPLYAINSIGQILDPNFA